MRFVPLFWRKRTGVLTFGFLNRIVLPRNPRVRMEVNLGKRLSLHSNAKRKLRWCQY